MKATLLLTLGLLPLLAGLAVLRADQSPRKGKYDMTTLLKGNNAFALDLYGRLRQQEGNLFFSPYSISEALAMTYAGARGQTAEQMARTLHFDLPAPRLHAAFAELIEDISGPCRKRDYQLTVANALWGQKGYTFLPDFVKLTETNYQAGVKEVDFKGATEKARQTINGWVEKTTNDKIKELLKPGILDESTRLVLSNAIYFKAAWGEPFSEDATKDDQFKVTADKQVPMRLMHRIGAYGYLEQETFQAVALPYAGGELSMVVFLPKTVGGLTAFEQLLTAARLDGWLAKMNRRLVSVDLPKFTTTSEFGLARTLSEMGMPLAFTGAADFSGMTASEKLFLSAVAHKAYVDVNEKGTEAAAATAVAVSKAAVDVTSMVPFPADHPFVFLLREDRTGGILFLGRVTNPRRD